MAFLQQARLEDAAVTLTAGRVYIAWPEPVTISALSTELVSAPNDIALRGGASSGWRRLWGRCRLRGGLRRDCGRHCGWHCGCQCRRSRCWRNPVLCDPKVRAIPEGLRISPWGIS